MQNVQNAAEIQQRVINLVELYRTKVGKWRNRSIPTQFRTSESTHSVMKMTMEWP